MGLDGTGRGAVRSRGGIARGAALLLIRLYRRVLSPLLPPACRFEPSCSEYAETAVSRFGLLRGGWLTLKRLARCNPLAKGGYDPVPGDTEGSGDE